jgi:hypothetical protein
MKASGLQGDQVGLVPVDALVVSGIDPPSFFWFERQIAEALAGAHLSWAQDEVIASQRASAARKIG